MRKGKRGQKVIPSANRGALNPRDRLRQQAYGLRNARNFAQAKPLLEELYRLEPDNMPLALDLGEAYMETEDFGSATSLYAKLIENDPKNINAVTNLGGSLIRLGKLDDARAILEYALQLDPKSIHARINLGSVLQASGERKANLDNALEAVQIDPSSSLAFNNLGSAFSDLAMFKEARHAYETAIMLDSEQIDALINLAAVEARLGDSKASAEMYERVIKKLPKEAEQRIEATKFYAAFEYLKQGVLEKGWDYYEGGFSPLVPAKGARTPRRNFDVPRWDGQPLNGMTLLVWREQGLGDELLFATCLHELEALGGSIIVECDVRLVTIFQRSFPQYTIRAETFLPNQGMKSPFSDFDLHLPMGSLMKYFRRDIKDFERSGAYIKPDPEKVTKFQERLAPYKDDYRLVGICWRSGKLDPVRNLSYTTLDEWGEVLLTPGFKFVNLQYGECDGELQQAEENYGVKILRWPDLNLRNDLDDIFALIHCLDAVASVQTAVMVMGGSVGVPTVGVKAGGWTMLGQVSKSPWNHKNGRVYNPDASVTRIYEFGALELVDVFCRQSYVKNHGDLRNRLSGVEAERLQNFVYELLQGLEQKTIRKAQTDSVNEVLKAAAETNYAVARPVLAQGLHSGILLKGTAGQRERARFLLDLAATAGREGDWQLADHALHVAKDLDRHQFQLRLPEYAWLKFIDCKIGDSTDLALKALGEIDWPTAAKFHLPRLLAECGDYDAAFELAELVVRNTPKSRGVYSAIAESALTDSDWRRMLDAYTKEETSAHLNQNEIIKKSSALLRSQGFDVAVAEAKAYYLKAQKEGLGILSSLALLNMHVLSVEELFTCIKADKSSPMANVDTFRAELIYLELKGESTEVDKKVRSLPSFPSRHNSFLCTDLCLASLICRRVERGWSLLSRLDVPEKVTKNTYVLRKIIECLKMNSKDVEGIIHAQYRENTWFWRNAFLTLDYCLHTIQGRDLCGLNSRDLDYRRYDDFGWIHFAIQPIKSVEPK